ncbi:MAG: phospholipase D family protein [Pseudomonadota bacterium]|nr:phospholipase D family protein [Pseudomonadota bacterium]
MRFHLPCGIASALALVLLCLAPGCAGRPPVTAFERTPTYAVPASATADTRLGTAAALHLRHDESGFHLLPNGVDAFLTRLGLVEAAERSVDLQYFSTRDDSTGKLLLDAVWRAANRGVRVRLLLDDWNLDDFKKGVAALNAHPNIEIRVFNPYVTNDQTPLALITNAIADRDALTRRMHNKALIADNQMAVMGGRNLGDEYFDASSERAFHDMDVLAAGPIVSRMSQSFDTYWNSAESYPLEALAIPPLDPQKIAALHDDWRQHRQDMLHSTSGEMLRNFSLFSLPLVRAKAELVADNPLKIETPPKDTTSKPEDTLGQLVRHAGNEFIIITPYFVPLDDGTRWLLAIAGRGVDVRILTNSLASTDMVMVHAGYSHYRHALLSGGIELYELKAIGGKLPRRMFKASSQASLHAKVYIIDRRDLVVGSFNMDPRSIQFNTEQVLVIHSPALAGQAAGIFEHAISPENSYRLELKDGRIEWITKKNGKMEYFGSDPEAGAMRRITDWLFGILPIDEQL